MADIGTGTIRIEGNADSFNNAIKNVNQGLQNTESTAKNSATAIASKFKESSVTIATNFLSLAGQIKGYIDSALNYIPEKMKLAADVERGNVAWLMLERQNKELFEAAQNTMEYSVGLLKVRDSIFVINDIMGKGINLNKKLYQDLIQTSTTAAIRLNKPIETMIEQFVAMGTKMEDNSEEMKMLGIQINKDKIFEEFARQTGKAVEELSEAEKKTAFLSELLEKMRGKSTVSSEEITGMTYISQAVEKYTDVKIDLEEKWAFKVSEVGLLVHKMYKDRAVARNLDFIAEQKTKEKLGVIDAEYFKSLNRMNALEYETTKQNILEREKANVLYAEKNNSLMIQMRNLHAANIQNHTSMERVEEQLTSLSKAYGQAEFPVKKLINVYKQLQKARTNQMKADIAEEQAIKDARVKDELIKILKSHYDKVNEVEFKAFEDKTKWEKLKAETILKWTKMSVAEIKKEKDDQDKALFDKGKNALILAKIKSTNESLRAELESYYDKNNQTEFKAYEDKEAWEKRKADAIKKWAKMGTAELRKEKKEQDKILFGKEKTQKEGEDFDKLLEENSKWYAKWNTDIDGMTQKIKNSNKEIRDKIKESDAEQIKNSGMFGAKTESELDKRYQIEKEKFKKYANENKLEAEQLAGGLLNIDRRYLENKKRLGIQEFDGLKESKKMMKDMMLSTTKATYDAILSDEENAMQKLLANSLIQAGGNIYAKGVENVWIGFGELVSTFGLKGGEQMAVGALQIGAGLGMGYVGKSALPSESGVKSEDSAKLENEISQQDKKMSDESKIFLFPSEQKWLEEINRANKKIKK